MDTPPACRASLSQDCPLGDGSTVTARVLVVELESIQNRSVACGSTFLQGGRPVDDGDVAVQALDLVELTDLIEEHVDDDIAIVE